MSPLPSRLKHGLCLAVLSENSLLAIGILPVAMIIWAGYGICALVYVRRGVTCWLSFYTVVLVLVIALQTVGGFVVFVWVKDSYR